MLAVYVPHMTTSHISGSFVKAILNLISMRWHKVMKGEEGGHDGEKQANWWVYSRLPADVHTSTASS